MSLSIRSVEVHHLHALRDAVLTHPGGPRQAHLKRDHADTTRHWGAWIDTTLIGCATVNAYRGWLLRGMAVHPDHQRQGIGAALLAHVVRAVDAPMYCNARLPAVPFYAAHGWQAEGPVFTLDPVGPHQRMTWTP